MRVLEPRELDKRRHYRAKKQKIKRRQRHYGSMLLTVTLLYVIGVMLAPLPALRSEIIVPELPKPQAINLSMPGYGQSAIGAVGFGVLAQNGEQKPLPIASVAKVITAVAILKARPMAKGSSGEMITITSGDEVTYERYLSEGQSVTEVKAGEKLTQYQALQALLLPSANNMADVLVRWAFGSTQEYLSYANALTKSLGMHQTNVDDASGFSPRTTSTAKDLVLLAEIAMNNPVITEIVGQSQAELPVAGTVYNVNNLLGQDGISGIKTGNTIEAGGCYMFSASYKIDETHTVTVVGVIVGAPERSIAMNDALSLLNNTYQHFRVVSPLRSNEQVGVIYRRGLPSIPIVIGQAVSIVIWDDQQIRIETEHDSIKQSIVKGDRVGSISLHVGNLTYELPLVADGSSPNSNLWWRFRHAAGRI